LRPLSESSYRRLSSLAAQLANTLAHPAGTNPKGYRLPSTTLHLHGVGVDAGVGRNIVDGAVLERYFELAAGRRGEMAGRAGYSSGGSGTEEVRSELEGVIGWAGLSYF